MKIFFLHDQKVMTKLKYLENENSFKGEIKSFFIILQGEIPSITKLATTAALSTKINEAKNKIPNITNLGTTIDFTPVENKIPIVRNLVKKIDYNTKMSEIKKKKNTNHDHDKYITTPEFTKLTSANFAARLAQANWESKVISLIL